MNYAVRTMLVAVTTTAAMVAQMEKRDADQYDPATFAAARPAVGSQAPDLQLCDLEGRPRALAALLGQTVVLVKGSFT